MTRSAPARKRSGRKCENRSLTVAARFGRRLHAHVLTQFSDGGTVATQGRIAVGLPFAQ